MLSLAASSVGETAGLGVLSAALGPVGLVADFVGLLGGGPNVPTLVNGQPLSAKTAANFWRSNMSRAQRQDLLAGGRDNVSFLSGLSRIGGIFGGITDTVRSIAGAIHPATTAAGRAATVAIDTAKGAAAATGRAVAAHPVLAAAGAAATAGAVGSMTTAALSNPNHPAHKAIKKALGLHHRRMHVTNTRALHRALRRVKGFERVARRVLSITRPGAHRVHFKFHKKRRAA